MARGITTVETVVVARDQPLDGIVRLVLADRDGWDLPPFRPGAHVDLHLARGLVRTYSLCNAPEERTRYVVAVKAEEAGRGGSRFVRDELRIGSILGVSLPRGGLTTSATAPNVFVAGGIGVTPFLSAIAALEGRGLSNYALHWACRGTPPFAAELAAGREAGRVHLYDTAQGARPDIGAILAAAGPEALGFCCGPQGMLDAFDEATASWPDERRHAERFAAPAPRLDPNARPYELVLARSGRSITVTPEIGLLGALDALEADVPVSCAGGICGACRTRWLEGPPIHADRVLTPAERENEVMVCVARCEAPRLVLDV